MTLLLMAFLLCLLIGFVAGAVVGAVLGHDIATAERVEQDRRDSLRVDVWREDLNNPEGEWHG